MEKYLYGAAVQGIQNFIFQTNELKDIVGASELVERICTTDFARLLYDPLLTDDECKKKLLEDECAIINAAGNIKYVFEDRKECEKIVREFPRKVIEGGPGITISQAVVAFDEGMSFADVVDTLEERLRTQRNKPLKSTTIGHMGMLRSRQTGLPVTCFDGQDYLDEATRCKRNEQSIHFNLCCKAFGEKIQRNQITADINKLTGRNDWIAIIHADGNGLGQVVQKVGRDKQCFKEFSNLLDKATCNAARAAFAEIEKEHNYDMIIPIRPIVLGGDDLTVVCRGDIALPYVTAFIKNFEQETSKLLGKILLENQVFTEGKICDRLTACAGIAFIKSSYPFYYGYELAESLCTTAKNDTKKDIDTSKQLPESCVMFHKVQDSFVESYKMIEERELKPNDESSFKFGPYYIQEPKQNRWTVDELNKRVVALQGKEGNAIKSGLRNWMTLLHDNDKMALQKLARIKEITTDNKLKQYVCDVTAGRKENGVTYYPTYDILAINTIINQATRSKED